MWSPWTSAICTCSGTRAYHSAPSPTTHFQGLSQCADRHTPPHNVWVMQLYPGVVGKNQLTTNAVLLLLLSRMCVVSAGCTHHTVTGVQKYTRLKTSQLSSQVQPMRSLPVQSLALSANRLATYFTLPSATPHTPGDHAMAPKLDPSPTSTHPHRCQAQPGQRAP
jgi:hypothetical protein